MMSALPLELLIVDDDSGHCELIRRNLKRSGIRNPIRVLHDGASAMEFLTGEGRKVPLMILLDINMPGGMDGVEVLRRLKEDEHHRSTPVIMLTTTDDQREVRRCYDLGCNVYVTKPVDMQQFIEVIRRLGLFIDIIKVVDR